MAYAGGLGGSNGPPEPEKIVVENDVISEGFIFSNKNRLKCNFSIEFSSENGKIFLKISPTNCIFPSKRAKI